MLLSNQLRDLWSEDRGNEPVLAFYAALGLGEDEVVSLGKRLVNDG